MSTLANLNKIKKVHFIGIKGVALSGLAIICKEGGFEVAGSDLPDKFITDKILTQNNIKIFGNFNPANLDWGPDLVVVGTSWSKDNIEYKEAHDRKLLVITDSDMRGILSRQRETIAVTGVHGKTTTTALLSYIFACAGLKPSYLVGTASIPDLGNNGHWDSGNYFIVEGDEYIKSSKIKIPKFLDLSPSISVITSLEWEHVDVYKDVYEMEHVFKKLIKKTGKSVVVCNDWVSIKKIIKHFKDKVITYGINLDAEWQLSDFNPQFDKTLFTVKYKGKTFDDFELKLAGQHNVLNALACIIVGLKAGIDINVIKEALKNFSGTERRFEVRVFKGVTYIDDYGHHPSEIKATLRAVKDRYPKRTIWCVFQPHTASRTMALLEDFANSFFAADKVIIVDIFASARESVEGINSLDLSKAIKSYHPDVTYAGNIYQTTDYLSPKIRTGDVVVTMGAGDIYKVRDNLIL